MMTVWNFAASGQYGATALPPAKTAVDVNLNSPDEDFRKIHEEIEEAKRWLAAQKDKPIIHY
jgi:hypothetical protein